MKPTSNAAIQNANHLGTRFQKMRCHYHGREKANYKSTLSSLPSDKKVKVMHCAVWITHYPQSLKRYTFLQVLNPFLSCSLWQ